MTQTTGADVSDAKTHAPVVRAEGLTKHFVFGGFVARLLNRRSVVRAVSDVDLTVSRGETLGIVGESGCGKSTLGRTLLRLQAPTEGRVLYGGEDVTDTPERRLRPQRRHRQMIFQDPKGSLNPRQTVEQVLRRTLRVNGVKGVPASKRIDQCLRDAELDPERFKPRYPAELSGGEAQRVGIARALLLEPELIIADEPVSSLDVTVQAQIINLLRRLRAARHLAMVFISHDMSVVRHISDRITVMYLGRVVEEGPASEVFDQPLHPYTRALLDAVPRVGKRRQPVGLSGQVPSPSNPPSGCPFHTRCPEKIGQICETEPPALTEVLPRRRAACHLHTSPVE